MSGIPPNALKRRLAEGVPQLGFWLSLNSIAATEIAAGGGFDWVLLDMEHSAYGIESVEHHLLAARHGGDAEFVVRVPSHDPNFTKRLLDSGVRSFMFPMVQTVEDARQAVASTRYPPHGIRGYSGIHRGNRFARDAGYPHHAHEDICVIAQIESPQAVDAIPGIGMVEGLDAVLIGPNDLAANMGLLGKHSDPAVRAKVADALKLIQGTRTAPGILDFDPQTAGAFIKQGFRLLAVGGDSTTLVRSMPPMLEAVREAAE